MTRPLRTILTFPLLILCATAALQFKKLSGETALGSNFISQAPNPLNDDQTEGDNAICYSETFIGMVDGESVRTGGFELPPKYLSASVATELFTKNAELFEEVTLGERSNVVFDKLLKAFKSGLFNGVTNYRKTLEQHTGRLYQRLLTNVPSDELFTKFRQSFDKAFNANVDLINGYKTASAGSPAPAAVEKTLSDRKPAIDSALLKLENKVHDHLAQLKAAYSDYLDQIKKLKPKFNSGVAVVSARLTQNKEGASLGTKFMKFFGSKAYQVKQATVQGLQYGRSFVALFSRKILSTDKNWDKTQTHRYIYTLLDYSQYKFRDLYRVYPHLGRQNDPEIKSYNKFEFPSLEGDILLVSDSTLVDNFSYSFIELLLNFGLHKLSKNDNWEPEGDGELVGLVKDYVTKMGSKDTVKYAYRLVSENSNFKTAKDFVVKGQGVAGCGLDAFFPKLDTGFFKSIGRAFKGKNNCVQDIAKAKYQLECNSKDTDSDNDPIVDKFDPATISKMFAVATRLVQGAMKKPPGGGRKPEAFLTYKQIIAWRDQKAINKKNRKAPFFTKNSWDFDKEVESGEYAPSQGDLSIFVNILVKNQATRADMTCLVTKDAEAAKLGKIVENYFKKTTNLEVQLEEEDKLTPAERTILNDELRLEEAEAERRAI